jgi:hypothetical protein
MNLSDFLIIWTERTITRKSRGLGAINPQTQETPRGDGGLIPQNYRGSFKRFPAEGVSSGLSRPIIPQRPRLVKAYKRTGIREWPPDHDPMDRIRTGEGVSRHLISTVR